MNVLPFELNTTSAKPQGKQEYLKPGAYQCKIVSITTSDLLENYKGSPFITFNVVSNSKSGRVQMWAVKSTDKPSTGEPVIRESVKYRWSNKVGSKCAYNSEMNKKLSQEDKSKYKTMMEQWGSVNSTKYGRTDEDLPF